MTQSRDDTIKAAEKLIFHHKREAKLSRIPAEASWHLKQAELIHDLLALAPKAGIEDDSCQSHAPVACEIIQSLLNEIEGMKKEGWVLVPKEPDSDMMNQGADTYRAITHHLAVSRSNQQIVKEIYEAMLKAKEE